MAPALSLSHNNKSKKAFILLLVIALLFVQFGQAPLIQQVFAAPQLTQADVMYTRMKASTASDALILFKGSTNIGTVNKLVITFGAATIPDGSCTTSTSNRPTNPANTAVPGTLSCTAASNVVTITGITAGLSSSTLYGVYVTGLTTKTAGTYTDTVSTYTSSTQEEATDVGSDIISNDQITVTATVPPSFTLSLSGSSDAFTANLSSSAVRTTTGVTVSAATNATNGWTAWIADANAGLTSAHASKTIASPAYSSSANSTLSSGTEGYVAYATAGTGTPSIDTGYSGDATHGGGMSTTYQRVAYGTAATSSQQFTVKELAAISATTPAGNDYTDTITIVGSGNF